MNVALSEVWGKGGEGGVALAEEVVRLCEAENRFQYSYDLSMTIEEKLNAIARRVYGGAGAELLPAAKKQARQLTELGFGGLPVCVAKTQYSFSDDPRSWARRRTSPSPCATCASRRARASSSPSPATS